MFSAFFHIWGFRVNRYNCIILLLFFMSFAFQNYCPYLKVAISSAVVDVPHASEKEMGRQGGHNNVCISTGGRYEKAEHHVGNCVLHLDTLI